MREKCYVCDMSLRDNELVIQYYEYPHIDPDLVKFAHLRCCTNDTFRRIGDDNKRIRQALGRE